MVYSYSAGIKVNGDLAFSGSGIRNGILQLPASFHIRESMQISEPF